MNVAELLPAEKAVLELVKEGRWADLSGGVESIDVAQGIEWGEDRTIRGEFLSSLCTGELAKISRSGLRIRGARVDGRIDLSFGELSHPILLKDCYCDLGHPLDLKHLKVRALSLAGTYVGGILGDGLTTAGSLYLQEGFHSDGEVRLLGARVANLYCGGGTFRNVEGDALSADGLEARGNVFLNMGCQVTGAARFPLATVGRDLTCDHCALSNPGDDALWADGANVGGTLGIADATIVGGVSLARASIGADLICVRTRFSNPGKITLDAEGVTVGGMVYLTDGFSADGEVRFQDGQLGGVRCGDATIVNEGSHTITADRATIDGGALFDKGFVSRGEARLARASVRGQVLCRGEFINSDGDAISADALHVRGDVFLREGFKALGSVRMVGANVDDLDCQGARFETPDGIAILGDGLHARGSVFLNRGFRADGEVRLRAAAIDGLLACSEGLFTNARRPAIVADGVSVGQGVFLDNGFTAKGGVRLLRAKITGQLNCRNGTFENASGTALDCEGATIAGDALLDGNFSANGTVDFLGASVSGGVACGGRFGNRGRAFVAERIRVQGALKWIPEVKPGGMVDLSAAHVGQLQDDPESWPETALLDGFVYDSVIPLRNVHDRLRWVRKYCAGRSYVPQPYEQLATIYRAAGHEAEARTVAVAREHARRATLKRRVRPLHWLFGLVVGYGYRLWRPLLPLIAAVVFGSFLFADANAKCGETYEHAHCAMTPTRDVENLPQFQPAVYALDSVLPIIDLRQQAFWTPEGEYRVWFWVFIATGWIFTTSIVGGFSRAVTRG